MDSVTLGCDCHFGTGCQQLQKIKNSNFWSSANLLPSYCVGGQETRIEIATL